MVAVAYRDIASGKIAAVFVNCETLSPYFNSELLFTKEIYAETPEIDESFKQIPKISETLEDKIKRIIREGV